MRHGPAEVDIADDSSWLAKPHAFDGFVEKVAHLLIG